MRHCWQCRQVTPDMPMSLGHLEGVAPKVYITTGIPTRVVGTCFCAENLGGGWQPIDPRQFQSLLICNDV